MGHLNVGGRALHRNGVLGTKDYLGSSWEARWQGRHDCC